MNTGQRLVVLSGLSGVSAAQHLLSIGTGATAGALLVSRSSLPSATAIQHLMDGGGSATVLWDLIRARRLGRR